MIVAPSDRGEGYSCRCGSISVANLIPDENRFARPAFAAGKDTWQLGSFAEKGYSAFFNYRRGLSVVTILSFRDGNTRRSNLFPPKKLVMHRLTVANRNKPSLRVFYITDACNVREKAGVGQCTEKRNRSKTSRAPDADIKG
jgi:hypothetical protein